MGERATITIHTTVENKERLARLAKAQDRSESYLGEVALSHYLENEERFVEGVLQGLKESEQGIGYSSEEVRAHLHDVVRKAAKS